MRKLGQLLGSLIVEGAEAIVLTVFGIIKTVLDLLEAFLTTGNPRALRGARKRFMRAHGRVFWILGIMQYFWYRNDKRRERFVDICNDKDVQALTWEAYMNKQLVRKKPLAHARIFFKDLRHLVGSAA